MGGRGEVWGEGHMARCRANVALPGTPALSASEAPAATTGGDPRACRVSDLRVLVGRGARFGALLADPPWQFGNRSGKVAPEHRRLQRYATMPFAQIAALPVGGLALPQSHLYLWTPNALVAEALAVMAAWGFTYKTNIVWLKVRRDGGPDGRGVGFSFRNATELLLFGVRGKLRTLPPGRRQVNVVVSRKRGHSRKPDETYGLIEACSPGQFLELFARRATPGWVSWGSEVSLPLFTQGCLDL